MTVLNRGAVNRLFHRTRARLPEARQAPERTRA